MGPNPSGKARIVARIKRESKKEAETLDGFLGSKQPWILVNRPDEKSNPNSSGRVKIAFGSDQISSGKQCYEVDECYEQDVGTEEIFSTEIKPLISGLFQGQNSTVFAYGPRNSGKTYTMQGSDEELGLVALTMASILPQAEEKGKLVTVSVFEVYQDRVIDLLDSKRPEVSVFEDGQGKIRLKGLSKAKVNSTSEFQRLYSRAANVHKPLQKTMFEPPHRSHLGCIVHVVSPQTENSNVQLVGKINFIDLASYEDSRRKSSDGSNMAETTRINKSLYAVHNVLYALNANEARVPYRESKLTRVLQDSLGGTNKVLMITCMNPFFCQETIQTISLASRSCQASFLACLDPGKSSRSATKTIGMSSPQVLKSASKVSGRTNMFSPKVMKPMSASASGKKQVGSLMRMSVKKSSGVQTEVKGRKLFDDPSRLKNTMQGKICPESAPATKSSAQTEIKLPLESEQALVISILEEENSALHSASDMGSSQLLPKEEKSALSAASHTDSSQLPPQEDVLQVENVLTATPTYETPNTACFLLEDKENKSLVLHDGASPPLSARIRELSNNLKSLCVSTESNLKMAQDSSILCNQVTNENLEPKTPIQPSGRIIDKYDITNVASPWDNFHMRSSGMKDSLVNSYLKFLNSANKEELKGIKGIGEKRATYILEKREESPEPFKKLDDLKDIGLSEKQIKGMLKNVAGDLFV